MYSQKQKKYYIYIYISIYQALHFSLLFVWFFTGHFSVPRCLNAETDAFVEKLFMCAIEGDNL